MSRNGIPDPSPQAPPGVREFLASVAQGVTPLFWLGIAVFIAGVAAAVLAKRGTRPYVAVAASGAGVAFVTGLIWLFATGSQ